MATRGSSAWRYETWGDPCPRTLTTISFVGESLLTVHVDIVPAVTALATVLKAHGYGVRKGDTGAYNCRHMRHDPSAPMSSHSWGTAIDINWQLNPAGSKLVTNMPKEMVADIMAIKTKQGKRVWRWGGDWDNRPDTPHTYYDAMHYEIHVTRDEMILEGIDWDTVVGTDPKVTIMKKLIYSRRGTPDGAAVKAAEELLPQDGLVSTTSKDTARRAVKAGLPVIAAGGPAYVDLVSSTYRKKTQGYHVHDNVTAIVGQTGIDTMAMMAAFAKAGWKVPK